MNLIFVPIPAGTFQMGLETTPEEAARRYGGEPNWYDNEQPRHTVTISRPFELGQTHVTCGQFAAFVAATGYRTEAEIDGYAQIYNGSKFAKMPGHSWRDPGFKQTDDHPVVCVTYKDAIAFCDWMARLDGRRYRLPTEAEWEHAYRADTNDAWTWGNNPADGVGHANCADATARATYPTWTTFDWSDGYLNTSPVASFKPNQRGLYDLAGNAWEWTDTFFAAYAPEAAIDPRGPAEGTHRVLRGGAWFGAPLSSRAAYRSKVSPGYRGSNVGFRVLRELN
jgi:formylglycine-generating enzyme required for sulfatase activity